jgi:phosphate acetyltransferase
MLDKDNYEVESGEHSTFLDCFLEHGKDCEEIQDLAVKNFVKLLQRAHPLPVVKTAVVHPTDKESLLGAVRSAELNLIKPILVGPRHKINNVAASINLDITKYEIVDTLHSHMAATLSVEMARKGDIDAIMKGALHTDELMAEIVHKDRGLRTDRRMSHAFLMSVATFHKPFVITDAALNICPTLEDKRDIAQNAIDFMCKIVQEPQVKVAVLSAVETVTSSMPATLDAASLSKMAERGQITNALVDGPLAFDNAISITAANIKGISSPVSGDADILLVPDLESGNMLAKQLKYLSKALMAGIVLGAKVPVMLTSRSDPMETRVMSSVLASLIYHTKL